MNEEITKLATKYFATGKYSVKQAYEKAQQDIELACMGDTSAFEKLFKTF